MNPEEKEHKSRPPGWKDTGRSGEEEGHLQIRFGFGAFSTPSSSRDRIIIFLLRNDIQSIFDEMVPMYAMVHFLRIDLHK